MARRAALQAIPQLLQEPVFIGIDVGQEMIAVARTELERAARLGVLPVQWVQDMMSEAGWNQYWHIRKGQQK